MSEIAVHIFGWKCGKEGKNRKAAKAGNTIFSFQMLQCSAPPHFHPTPPSECSSCSRYCTRFWFPCARQKLCTKMLLHVVLWKHRLLLSEFPFHHSTCVWRGDEIHWHRSRKWSTGLIAEMLLLYPVIEEIGQRRYTIFNLGKELVQPDRSSQDAGSKALSHILLVQLLK